MQPGTHCREMTYCTGATQTPYAEQCVFWCHKHSVQLNDYAHLGEIYSFTQRLIEVEGDVAWTGANCSAQ